ncbi:MAG: ECF transporter S component [Thaumarchaeota archaeon]|nr:ECF transporter S component [Nitrososphaerota archaeon]
MRTRTVASTAIFTAFVAAVTLGFVIVIPATKGYFNIGEIMVYVVAMLMGPYIGAFAGGVGSAISDALLAPVYAPGTLVIKGMEGLIVGYLTNLPMANLTRRLWVAISTLLGGVLATLVALLGMDYLSGPQNLYLGLSYCSANCSSISPATTAVGPQFSANFNLPWELWIVVGVAAFLVVVGVGLSLDEKLGWTIIAILAGGSEMVIGYFIYESMVLQLGFITASAEAPFNIGQVLVGLLVAVPVVRSYRRIVRRNPKQTSGTGMSGSPASK